MKIYELQSQMMNMHEPPQFSPTRIVQTYKYPDSIYINKPTAILIASIVLALLLCFGIILLVIYYKFKKL